MYGIGVRPDGQPGAGQLQRVKSGHYRRGKSLGGRTGETQNHRQLRGAGLIDTEIVDENVPVGEILKAVPAARMGLPEEVAHAVHFLMDEKAAYITRQVIAVNGGLC